MTRHLHAIKSRDAGMFRLSCSGWPHEKTTRLDYQPNFCPFCGTAFEFEAGRDD